MVSCKFPESNSSLVINKFIDNSFQAFLFLKRLDLSSAIKGDIQCSDIACSSAFKHIEFLKLKNCGISNIGFTTLVSSKNLKGLKVLILAKNKISKLGLPYDDMKGISKI